MDYRAPVAVLSKPARSSWISPIACVLGPPVEPLCSVCGRMLENWDLYFDHITFDQECCRADKKPKGIRVHLDPPLHTIHHEKYHSHSHSYHRHRQKILTN